MQSFEKNNTVLIPPRYTKLLGKIKVLLKICTALVVVFSLLILFLPAPTVKPICLIFFILNFAFIVLLLSWLNRFKLFLKETALIVSNSRDLMWAMNSHLNMTSVCGDTEHITGQDITALLNQPLVSILPEHERDRFNALVRDNKPFSMACRIPKEGNIELPVEIIAAPIDLSGQNIFHGVIKDMTDQIKIQDLETELNNSKKLKNLGILAGSIAHDLNNILAGMTTYPEILLLNPDLAPKVRESLVLIKESGRNASAVVNDLLTISRGTKEEYQILNINTIIERFMATPEFEKIKAPYEHVEIDMHLEPELLNISGSYIHIEKSIKHLVINAFEQIAATTDGGNGTIAISTSNHYIDKEKEVTLPSGEYVVLEVLDTGNSIPKDYLDKIFDPLFTQKEMGRPGTGLGLTVVKHTVLNHRGEIFVASDANGTKFTCRFPALRPELPMANQTVSIEEIQGNGETILVVDDLADQRKIAEVILKHLRYKVFSVSNGISALDFIMQTPVDLLILDMVMAPSISGLETYKRIKKIRPDQKAIIASGHSQSEDVLKVLAQGAGAFIKKPYTILDMGIAVKEELDR